MKTRSIIGTLLAAFVIFQSCTKEETSAPRVTLIEKIVTDIPADTIVGFSPIGQPIGAGKFTFYSFETNSIVPSSDSNSTKWDIAMRGTTIITNNGTSGPGKGGAFVYVGTFDDLTLVPADSTFKVDAAPTSYAITIGSNKGWYLYTPQTNLVTPVPGRVLVIKTATGRYAKVEIINYYKGGTTPPASASDAVKTFSQRYYTFRFTYQADGTTSFK
jgi:hypothetical protein